MRDHDRLPFPTREYQARLGALRERMDDVGVIAMITTTPENITYLTGFESPGHYWWQGLIVPLYGEPTAVSRLLEISGMDALSWIEPEHNVGYRDDQDPMKILVGELTAMGLDRGRIGYERDGWFFTAAQQDRLFSLLPEVDWIDGSGLVEAGRLVKSPLEIERIRAAARTTEAGMQAGVDAARAGSTENDVAAEVMSAMIRAGSEWPSIVPFVASGERGAIGHATWSGRRLEAQDTLFLEISGCRSRYHAPMMRTVMIGDPDPAARHAFEAVQAAFDAALATVAPGVPAGDVDHRARQVIAEFGFGGMQASRVAYSVGIAVPPDWGEGQILSMKPGETRPLQENMTFHLLPWVQMPGKGGIGCTETIRVTAEGGERITDFPRDLFVR
ncbi:MAG: Xaa-Pro peptidase family protein [Trueperaceae bacterium]|nr:Xaa-Pro peptidase family protein [Trueperaceae bacterium]